MTNFSLGLHAIFSSLVLNLKELGQYRMLWGFAIGFFVSTIVYAFITTENPRNIPQMALQDKAIAFQAINKRAENASYDKSFVEFSKEVDNLKLTFGIAMGIITILLLITLIATLLK